jgi:SAM-dependent methyltransferase
MTAPEDEFSREEARRFWEVHHSVRGRFDPRDDPEGLANVCHPGEPAWVNRYYAAGQRRVFLDLLAEVPAAEPDARALDVGCGAGRWTRMLLRLGYSVTGIDLQEELLAVNRQTLPRARFVQAALQEFDDPQPYQLATSVTVIQHIPYPEQAAALARLRALLAPGGWALMLENVRDRGPHVYSHSIPGWIELIADSGLSVQSVRRYDYSPALRTLTWFRRRLGPSEAARRSSPESYLVPSPPDRPLASLKRAGVRAATRLVVAADAVVEPALVRRNPRLPTVHCGFLVRAPGA